MLVSPRASSVRVLVRVVCCIEQLVPLTSAFILVPRAAQTDISVFIVEETSAWLTCPPQHYSTLDPREARS